MTLLVGVLCSNGAVIAADRQASHGAFGQVTVGQQVTKIKVIGKQLDGLFASSGAVGISQQISYIVESDQHQFRGRNYHSTAPLLQEKFRKIIEPAFQTAGVARNILGQAAQSDAICGSLLAGSYKDGLILSEISPQGGFEAFSSDIPFVCLGSGKQNADPFLRYIWSIYFDGGLPNLSEGSLAAYWTVKAAIDLKSIGVGFKPDVFVLEQKGKEFTGRQLAQEELAGHDEYINEATQALLAIKNKIRGLGVPAPPTPPTMTVLHNTPTAASNPSTGTKPGA
jgi:20S proteasome alpha/beta subunit